MSAKRLRNLPAIFLAIGLPCAVPFAFSQHDSPGHSDAAHPAASTPGSGQVSAGHGADGGHGAPSGDPEAPIALVPKALGSFTRPISSTNPEAQAFFNQGFQMRYAYATAEAARSFREAWKRDPNCAICYWGEAWGWGPYFNEPLTEENAPRAYAAIQKALSLSKDHANPREQALIDAMGVRFEKDFKKEDARKLDEAYAAAMRTVFERFPNDLDIATLYAEALLQLEERRGTRKLDDPNVVRIHQVLEAVLEKDIRHPGACHLYIHATESTADPGKASACAEFIGNSVPGASHLNHMPSHTWNELGRWGDSVRANIQAWHSDLKAAVGEGIAIYPKHNLHMLLFAASMDGQGAIAIQAGKDYGKGSDNSMYQLLTLVRFGRFDEVAAISSRPGGAIPAGVWDFAQAYAQLRLGEPDFAEAHRNRLRKAMTSTDKFRELSARDILGVLDAIVEGEIRLAKGDLEGAIASHREAVAIYNAFPYDEPEVLPFAAHHWLGATLLKAGRAVDAEAVYREDLANHPHNGWSLLGLQQALQAQGKASPDVDADLKESWARSDTWTQSSRF